jgi:hypothetical protein
VAANSAAVQAAGRQRAAKALLVGALGS